MIERYSREEIKNIWLDKNRYALWLKIEIAAAEAMEKYKIIPKGIVRKVKAKSKIDVEKIIPNTIQIFGNGINGPLNQKNDALKFNSPVEMKIDFIGDDDNYLSNVRFGC